MSDFAQLAPKSITARPLSKGMNIMMPPQALELGAAVNLMNAHVTTNGLRVRGGIQPVTPVTPFAAVPLVESGEKVLHFIPFYTVGGAKSILAITNWRVYQTVNLVDWIELYWANNYTIDSVNAGAKTVTVNAGFDIEGDYVRAGMFAELTDGAGTYSRHEITLVTGNVLTLDTWPAFTVSTGAGKLKIYREFQVNEPFTIQYAVSPIGIFLVDGTENGIYLIKDDSGVVTLNEHFCHDGTTLTTRVFEGAVSVAWVSGRLVVGSPYEVSGRQRVRWSSILNTNTFDPRDYVDCTQASGTVQRVTNLEDYPVVFLTDSIYVGQPYGVNIPDASAWVFRPVEIGRTAMVGPDAFTAIPNGMVYLARDDYYMLSPLKRNEKGDFQAEAMRCEIFKPFFRDNDYAYKSKLLWDTTEEAILTAVFDNANSFNTIAAFYSKTAQWSYHTFGLPMTSLQDISAKVSELWSDYDALDWTEVPGLTWFAVMSGFGLTKMVFTSIDGIPYNATEVYGTDGYVTGGALVQNPISLQYETGDMDFGEADAQKSCYKLALRIGGRIGLHTAAVNFNTDISYDRGRSWKRIGVLSIQPDEDENELHMRGIGTNLRLRLALSNIQPPFDIEELTYRIRLSAQQIVRGTGG